MKPTPEQTIAWIKEAGFIGNPERNQIDLHGALALAYEAGRKDENEACAVFAAEFMRGVEGLSFGIANAIRARREQ